MERAPCASLRADAEWPRQVSLRLARTPLADGAQGRSMVGRPQVGEEFTSSDGVGEGGGVQRADARDGRK